MANYKGYPLVAISDNGGVTVWLTPDGNFRITHTTRCPVDKDCYTLEERYLSRLGDEFMRFHWVEVLQHVDRDLIREALHVNLYPYGSEPSPEDHAPGGQFAVFDHDAEPCEWLTPTEYFEGEKE